MNKRAFGIDLQSGIADAGVVLATKIWLILAGLINQALLAWLLAPEGRGAYAVCFTFATVLGAFFTLASERSAQYYLMKNQMTLSQAVILGTTLTFLGSLLAIVVGYLLINQDISYFHKAEHGDFLLALVLVPLSTVNTALGMQLAGLRRFIEVGLISVVRLSFNMALFFLLMSVWKLGVTGGLVTLIICQTIGLAAHLFVLRRFCGLALEWPERQHFLWVLNYGIRFYVAWSCGLTQRVIGTVLLGMVASQAEIGIFAASVALVNRTLVFSDSIDPVILPRIAKRGTAWAPLAEQAGRISGLLTVFAVVGLVVVSYPVVWIVLSPAFLPAVDMIWILGISIVIVGYSKSLVTYLQATNQPGATSWMVCTSLGVNSVATLTLYPILGVSGAAWAMVLAVFARTAVLFFFYHRATGRSPLQALRPKLDDLTFMKTETMQILGKLRERRL